MSPYLDALESRQDGRWPLDRKAIVAGCRDECKKAHLLEVGDRIWSRYLDLWSKDLLNLELAREVDGLRDAMDRCTAEVLRLESRIRELENPDI